MRWRHGYNGTFARPIFIGCLHLNRMTLTMNIPVGYCSWREIDDDSNWNSLSQENTQKLVHVQSGVDRNIRAKENNWERSSDSIAHSGLWQLFLTSIVFLPPSREQIVDQKVTVTLQTTPLYSSSELFNTPCTSRNACSSKKTFYRYHQNVLAAAWQTFMIPIILVLGKIERCSSSKKNYNNSSSSSSSLQQAARLAHQV